MTTMTKAVEAGIEILKTGCLARVKTERARREAILDEFERGGGKPSAVCGELRKLGLGSAMNVG